jgi:acetyl esterase/lipase
MDVFTPIQKSNGKAVAFFISEGWYSAREKIEYNIPIYIQNLVKHGYTVFAIVHGSNPKYSLPEIVSQARKAICFIKQHATEFKIDPNRIGATGDSAGGHLSLMVGSADSTNIPDNLDYHVKAVVAFFPPTDFFNWGEKGKKMFGNHIKVKLKAVFTFSVMDSLTNTYKQVSDSNSIDSIVRTVSPYYIVNAKSAPTLFVYGDQDSYVPIQQSQTLCAKLKDLHVPTKEVVEKGGDHDEKTIINNFDEAIQWFDTYLK